MNQLAKAPRRSVLVDMAGHFGMEADAFEMTVRAQCSPTPKKGEQFRPLTREEFAAFLLVAKKYDLNPLTREIFAYPKRGGGVVPIVSIDGWINLVNSHPACDGFQFTWERDANGDPISCTCIMHRKDRSHPTAVTEYLAECWRDTEPWKMKHRMLRHKALMQCARYAFGFAGIYDEDEGRRIAEDQNIALLPPAPRAPRIGQQSPAGEKIQTAQGDATEVESGTGQPPVDSASPLMTSPTPIARKWAASMPTPPRTRNSLTNCATGWPRRKTPPAWRKSGQSLTRWRGSKAPTLIKRFARRSKRAGCAIWKRRMGNEADVRQCRPD
ncbi:RecT family recombinase [Sinorhizobium medicae]|uniref:RecT family recombinase n=1 Tax=Sinorhizobium medicae TaxID=110321 RepID=UPI002AF6B515|nr:RecT family recombinase [Sinorhizobium medicae]WQO71621.1 RecT family recombinase [Sinorhizobium medicae]